MDNNIIWAAGFLDGEGTFTIKRVRYQRDKSKVYHQPYISCAQTVKSKVAIQKLQKTFGGNLYQYHQKGNRLNTITWAAASRDAKRCAETLLPYLVLKRQQAKTIIKFYKLMEMRKRAYRLRGKDYGMREQLYWKIRKLNVKGVQHLKRLSERTAKADATV